MTTAKRGDLVLVEYRTDYGARAPEWSLERVTSVTRDGYPSVTSRVSYALPGRIETSEPFFCTRNDKWGSRRVARTYYVSHLLINASGIDAAAAWAAWLARMPEGGWRPEPFETTDDARMFLAPFRAVAA